MRNLLIRSDNFSLYEIKADSSTTQAYDTLEISLDSSIWVEPTLSYSGQLITVEGKPRLLLSDVFIKFNNRASSTYGISDSRDIINEWTEAADFVKKVRDYIIDNNWLTR